MAIEIKQLLIKSTITDEGTEEAISREAIVAIKDEVLDECRRLIKEMASDRGQR